MARYTVIGPSYRSGFNNPDRAHTAAEQIAKRTGGEVTIVHNYEIFAKYGPEGLINIDGVAPDEMTVITPKKRGKNSPMVFDGRLDMHHIRGIIQDLRTKAGHGDEIPQFQFIETAHGFSVQFPDNHNFDVIFAIRGEA